MTVKSSSFSSLLHKLVVVGDLSGGDVPTLKIAWTIFVDSTVNAATLPAHTSQTLVITFPRTQTHTASDLIADIILIMTV